MKIRNLLSLLLVLLLCLSACGGSSKIPEVLGFHTSAVSIVPPAPTASDTLPAATSVPTEPSAPATSVEPDAPAVPAEPQPAETDKNEVDVLRLWRGSLYENDYQEFRGEYVNLCTIRTDLIYLGDEDAKAYPKLADALATLRAQREDSFQEICGDMTSYAYEVYERGDFAETHYRYEDLLVQRADENALSLLMEVSYYEGDAHPSHWYRSINIDTATGRILTLADAVTDPAALPGLIETAFVEKYPSLRSDTAFRSALKDAVTDEMPGWTLGYDGLTIWLHPGDTNMTHDSLLTITLDYDDYPDLFPDAYTRTPSNYAVDLPAHAALPMDIDGDGAANAVSLTLHPDEYGYAYGSATLYLDGSSREYELYAYEVTPYAVHMEENGKAFNYLLMETLSDNDYRTTYLFDLNTLQSEPLDTLSGSGFAWRDEESPITDYMYSDQVLTDPEDIDLYTRVEILSTMTGADNYTVDNLDKKLRAKNAYYTLINGFTLTTLTPIDVVLLPDGSTLPLPVGSDLKLLRTDGVTFVEARLDDGRECQIAVDTSDWPATVCGKPIDECFDGMMFAG